MNTPLKKFRVYRRTEASAWLGLTLDAEANARGGPRIATAESKVSAWVVPNQRGGRHRPPHGLPPRIAVTTSTRQPNFSCIQPQPTQGLFR